MCHFSARCIELSMKALKTNLINKIMAFFLKHCIVQTNKRKIKEISLYK